MSGQRRPVHSQTSAPSCRGRAPVAAGGTSGGRTARARVAVHAGHHHPHHPPRALAPTRVGRGPAGANTHRRPAGHRRLSVMPGPPATLTHRVSHTAQRADLPRVRPDPRRRDLEWQNRAGHHHPYHPPLTFAPTRAGRAPAGANTHRRPAGHRCLRVMPGPPATLTRPCVTHGPARRSAAGTPRSPSAGPRVAEPRAQPPPISPTTSLCAHSGRAGTSWREHPPETCGAPVSQRDDWATGHPDPTVSHAVERADLPRGRRRGRESGRWCGVTRGPARRSAADGPRSPPAGPRTAEPRGPRWQFRAGNYRGYASC